MGGGGGGRDQKRRKPNVQICLEQLRHRCATLKSFPLFLQTPPKHRSLIGGWVLFFKRLLSNRKKREHTQYNYCLIAQQIQHSRVQISSLDLKPREYLKPRFMYNVPAISSSRFSCGRQCERMATQPETLENHCQSSERMSRGKTKRWADSASWAHHPKL